MVGFCNILVHQYTRLDPTVRTSVMTIQIHDTLAFAQAMTAQPEEARIREKLRPWTARQRRREDQCICTAHMLGGHTRGGQGSIAVRKLPPHGGA